MDWLVINIIESLLLTWFVSSLLDIKDHNQKNIYRLTLAVFNFIAITFSNYIDFYDIFLTSFLIVSNSLISLYFTKDEFHKILFVLCFETVFVLFTNELALLINSLLNGIDSIVLSKVIYPIIGYFLIKYIKAQELYFNAHLYYILSVILFGLQFVISHLIQIYHLFEQNNPELQLSFIMFSLCIVGFLYMLVKISDLYKSKESYEKLKQEKSNEQVLSTLFDQLNIMKHDLNHNFRLIDYYLREKDYDKINQLIMVKEKELNDIPGLIHSKNRLINIIVNNKMIQAYTKNIPVQCVICVDEFISINDYDMNELLSNILDNAIENCSKDGFIKIDIIQQEQLLHIKVENSIDEYSDLKTKKDKLNHGFGLMSIERIAHKYQGDVEIVQRDFTFTLTATLLLI